MIINIDDSANKYCRRIALIYRVWYHIIIYRYINNTEIRYQLNIRLTDSLCKQILFVGQAHQYSYQSSCFFVNNPI